MSNPNSLPIYRTGDPNTVASWPEGATKSLRTVMQGGTSGLFAVVTWNQGPDNVPREVSLGIVRHAGDVPEGVDVVAHGQVLHELTAKAAQIAERKGLVVVSYGPTAEYPNSVWCNAYGVPTTGPSGRNGPNGVPYRTEVFGIDTGGAEAFSPEDVHRMALEIGALVVGATDPDAGKMTADPARFGDAQAAARARLGLAA